MSNNDDVGLLFDANYLRYYHLNGPVKVKITKVEKKVEMRLPGSRAAEYKPVLHYEVVAGKTESTKPLVLNKTNAGLIAAICGRSVGAWVGKEVVLFESTARLGKDTVACIRVRAAKK